MTLPVEVNPLLIDGGGYQISRSVRLRSSASAYFNRTPGSAGNRRLWTWSGWVKRSTLGAAQFLFNAGSGASTFEGIQLTAADTLIFYTNVSGTVYRIDSTALFRDPSAWYHIVCAIDTAQATASNRIKFYINGVQLTSFSPATYPPQNYDTLINSTISHGVGAGFAPSALGFLDGYLTEINFIDGQALTPASFGETDPATGVWRAKKYSGTYGTNGFYLNFSDNSNNTATTIGKDYSGNGNNWTPNNISVTSGVTYDSMLDTPTPYADGGNGRGNYATLNPLNNALTLSNANLNFQNSTNAPRVSTATVEIPSGSKTYFEMSINTLGGAGNYSQVGIVPPGKVLTSDIGAASGNGYSIEQNAAQDFYLRLNGSSVGPISVTPTSGDVLQVAVDMSTGKLWFGRNNTWYNSTGGTTGNPGAGTNETVTISTSASWFPAVNKYNTAGSYSVNFGQRPFAYTPPSGFKALNTQNLPAPTIAAGGRHMAATTYTGTGSSLSVTNTTSGLSFQPDLVWIKSRSAATDHALYDAVRGVQLQLESNTTTDETTETTGLTAFNSNGFTVGALAQVNTSTATYVAWQWKESATAGFDIVTYTGNGANRTIAHNLGVSPSMMIVKARTTASTDQGWPVYHTTTGSGNYLMLDTTAASTAGATYWNSTAPTSSVFSLGTNAAVNTNNDTYVAYLFAPIAGFSAFGSYTGNGSTDGPFVYTGFRPRWVMVKAIDTTGTPANALWEVLDTTRDATNLASLLLRPNQPNAEATSPSTISFDILSNGFKARASGESINQNGIRYIYAAFAENPFKYALAR